MARKRIAKKITSLVDEYLKTVESGGIPIQAAYIFGSQAKGTARDTSDIDVCIISPKFKNPGDALRILWRKKTFPYANIGPVGYSKKDFNEFAHPLVAEIKKNNIQVR